MAKRALLLANQALGHCGGGAARARPLRLAKGRELNVAAQLRVARQRRPISRWWWRRLRHRFSLHRLLRCGNRLRRQPFSWQPALSPHQAGQEEGRGATARLAPRPSCACSVNPVRFLRVPPKFVPPCVPTTAKAIPRGDAWQHEPKLDGYRLQIIKDGPALRLYSRRGYGLDQAPGEPGGGAGGHSQ